MYEGDTAQDLAEKFCQEHDLDEETQKNLEALLEQQIASVLTKIDENEEDAESYETSNWLWERGIFISELFYCVFLLLWGVNKFWPLHIKKVLKHNFIQQFIKIF